MYVLIPLLAAALGTDLGVNLLTNGDAETGDMTGWTPVDTIEAKDSTAAGDLGLPPGVSLGEWCFTGGLGAAVETCVQTIDVSDLSNQIDAGDLPCTIRGLLQARSVGGGNDSVALIVAFLNEIGSPLSTQTLVDPVHAPDVHDWNEVELVFNVPVTTRSITFTIYMDRDIGASTDAFADNLELILGECPADCNGDGSLNILDFVCFQSEFQNQTPKGDCDANGLYNILDFVCFQGLFQGGCP